VEFTQVGHPRTHVHRNHHLDPDVEPKLRDPGAGAGCRLIVTTAAYVLAVSPGIARGQIGARDKTAAKRYPAVHAKPGPSRPAQIGPLGGPQPAPQPAYFVGCAGTQRPDIGAAQRADSACRLKNAALTLAAQTVRINHRMPSLPNAGPSALGTALTSRPRQYAQSRTSPLPRKPTARAKPGTFPNRAPDTRENQQRQRLGPPSLATRGYPGDGRESGRASRVLGNNRSIRTPSKPGQSRRSSGLIVSRTGAWIGHGLGDPRGPVVNQARTGTRGPRPAKGQRRPREIIHPRSTKK